MSAVRTRRLPLDAAESVAGSLSALLADACERIVIVGAIRRRVPEVRTVEYVMIPRVLEWVQGGLFDAGVPYRSVNLLDRALDALVDEGVIARRANADGRLVWGPYAKALTYRGVPVGIWTPEAERAGWIILDRTGPAAFARQLAVERPTEGRPPARTLDGRLGLCPPSVRPRDGWLTDRTSGRRIETPTERSAFDVLELGHLEPWERR
jgi:hypothetical protein